jgi:hypothetical protein
MARLYLDPKQWTIGLRLTTLPPQGFENTLEAFKIRFPQAYWDGSKWILALDYTDELVCFLRIGFPSLPTEFIVVSSTAA